MEEGVGRLKEGVEEAPAVKMAHLVGRLRPGVRVARSQVEERALSTAHVTGTMAGGGLGGLATLAALEAVEVGMGAVRDGTQVVVAALWSADQGLLMKTTRVTRGATAMAG